MSNGSSPSSDWEQGYGYQFWRSRHGFYRGDGAHGQFCLVLPQYDAVVAITSGTRDMGSVMNLVWERLVPALKAGPLPVDAASHRKLTDKLATLTLRSPAWTATSAMARTVAGKLYAFDSNKQSIESIALEPSAKGTLVIIRSGGVDQRLTAGYDAWTKGTFSVSGASAPVASSGAWTAEDTYTLDVVRYRTPFATNYQLRFAGDQLFVKIEQNVGPADARVTELVGKLATAAAKPQR